MRYVFALAVSCIILGSLLVNHWWVEDNVRELAEQARYAAKLPPGTPLSSVGIRLPPSLMVWFEIDRFFQRTWFLLGLLVVGLCFGVAGVLPRFLDRKIAHAAGSARYGRQSRQNHQIH